MGETTSEYRMFGVVYIILGLWFLFYFLYGNPVSFNLVFCCGSLVLVLFGLVLLVREVLWVARVSGILCGFLLVSYLVLLFLPFTMAPL